LLAAATQSFAEDAHHPEGTAGAPSAAVPAAPDTAASGAIPGQMMGPGMMSEMMFRMMPGVMSGPGMMAMAPEHIEGRIAFLKTELKIAEAQQPLWDAFADALRASARDTAGMMADMQGAMMPTQTAAPVTLPQRIELYERTLAARLDSLRQLGAASQPLYAAFDDTQKRTADTLLMVGPMGLM
jgi:hypothetical protein